MRQSCIDGAEEQRSEPVLELVQIVHYATAFIPAWGDKRSPIPPMPWTVTT